MRLCQIHSELNAIKRQLRAGKRQVCQEQLQRYAMDGIMPESEPAQSFALLMQAFDRMIDASIGGGDYDEARGAYEAACRRWKRAERGLE